MELSDNYQKLLENPLTSSFAVDRDGNVVTDLSKLCVRVVLHVFPGSFNPIHEGHRKIFDNIDGDAKVFEISIARWGKEPLDLESLTQRIQQFRGYATVVVTNAPRFIEKCAVFKTCNPFWHIGIDTIRRMRDDYGELGIAGLIGRFHVYDRGIENNGLIIREAYPLDFKMKIPNVVRGHFQIPDDLLLMSSTRIREAKKNEILFDQRGATLGEQVGK